MSETLETSNENTLEAAKALRERRKQQQLEQRIDAWTDTDNDESFEDFQAYFESREKAEAERKALQDANPHGDVAFDAWEKRVNDGEVQDAFSKEVDAAYADNEAFDAREAEERELLAAEQREFEENLKSQPETRRLLNVAAEIAAMSQGDKRRTVRQDALEEMLVNFENNSDLSAAEKQRVIDYVIDATETAEAAPTAPANALFEPVDYKLSYEQSAGKEADVEEGEKAAAAEADETPKDEGDKEKADEAAADASAGEAAATTTDEAESKPEAAADKATDKDKESEAEKNRAVTWLEKEKNLEDDAKLAIVRRALAVAALGSIAGGKSAWTKLKNSWNQRKASKEASNEDSSDDDKEDKDGGAAVAATTAAAAETGSESGKDKTTVTTENHTARHRAERQRTPEEQEKRNSRKALGALAAGVVLLAGGLLLHDHLNDEDEPHVTATTSSTETDGRADGFADVDSGEDSDGSITSPDGEYVQNVLGVEARATGPDGSETATPGFEDTEANGDYSADSDGRTGPNSPADIGYSANGEYGGGTLQEIYNVVYEEGLSDMSRELGVAAADRERLIELTLPELIEKGFVYQDDTLPGTIKYGINKTGEVSQDIIDAFVSSAEEAGIAMNYQPDSSQNS